MRKISLLLLLMFNLIGCQKEQIENYDSSIYGTWYYKIDRVYNKDIPEFDGHPIYLELYLNGVDKSVKLTTHLTETNHYWSNGYGEYKENGEYVIFDFSIDVPREYEWFKEVNRKFLSGYLHKTSAYPLLCVDIESTIDGVKSIETFMFDRRHPVVDIWWEYKDK